MRLLFSHLACSILSGDALMPATGSLDVELLELMRSCLKPSHDAPDMLAAAILNVGLAATSHSDVPVHLSLAGAVRLELCPMS